MHVLESHDRSDSTEHSGGLWLVGLEGNARKVCLPATSPILVGRGSYNHLVLADPRVSRQHARVAPELEGYVVYDLNSVNGTFVNGLAVARQVLAPNDVIRFGPYAFRVERGPAGDRAEAQQHPASREPPTLRAIESVSKMVAIVDGRDSAARLPIVNLTRLEDAYENLATLYSFVQAISTTIDRRELLALIAGKIRDVYPTASAVGIYLHEGEGGGPGSLRLAHSVGAPSTPLAHALPEDLGSAVLDARKGVLTGRAAGPGGASMYVPMVDRGQALGVIHVTAEEHGGTFSRDDLDLLSGMAAPAAIMLQNTRMHEEALARSRLDYDLALAAQIQKSFLPREVALVDGVELFAEYRAAYSVGGDFYDVFWVGPDKLAVFIGDIAGKGVAAALLMARVSSELRASALAHVDPVAVLTATNTSILRLGQPELFFTAIYFTIDVKTGDVLLANAGHPSPYCSSADGRVEAITMGAACAVGILDDPGYTECAFRLEQGASLVLYTDGVVEAAGASGELYGSARLEACLLDAGVRPNEIAERIIDSVGAHAAQGPVNDDLTLFICHRSKVRSPSLQPRRRSSELQAVADPRSPR